MLRFIFLLSLITFIIGCVSTSSKVYKTGALSQKSTYSIVFAYEAGEEETSLNNDGVERKIIRKGHKSSSLALRDNIYFNLMDKGIYIVDKNVSPDIIIELHPTPREANCNITCGAINTLSVVFRESTSNTPVARILINNGDRVATTMDEIEFSNYTAQKIYAVINGK